MAGAHKDPEYMPVFIEVTSKFASKSRVVGNSLLFLAQSTAAEEMVDRENDRGRILSD